MMNSSTGSESMSAKPNKESSVSKLNPFAREWHPARDKSPEEARGLFLTFSRGRPLSENEIFQFFQQRFGPCIERIYHPRHRIEDNRPMYAKVIFCYSYIPIVVLGNKNEAKFMVNHKPMWCKKFRPLMMIQN